MFSNSELFALVQRQATLIAASDLIPKQFQGNVPNCAIALEMASRLGASPFAVIQNMYVVHGRPSWSAIFLMGMVNSCGRFTPLQYKIEVTGAQKTITLDIEAWEGPQGNRKKVVKKQPYTYTPTRCIAWAKDKQTGEVVEGPPVSYDMALEEGWVAKDGSKWQTEMREVMLRYRAAAFFAKVHASDITLGMQTREELEDIGPAMRNVTPPEETLAGALTNSQPAATTTATAEVVTEQRRVRPAPKPAATEAPQEIDPAPPSDDEPNLIEPTPEELAAAKELRERIVKGVGALMKAKKLKLDAVEAGLKNIGWLGRDKLSECSNEELQSLIDNPTLLDFPTEENPD
jgi:hypothetical protein